MEKNSLFRLSVLVLAAVFCAEQAGFAQFFSPGDFVLPAYLRAVAPVADAFRPAQLRGVFADGELDVLKFLVYDGDSRVGTADDRNRVVGEYFRIGLRLPDESFWVNLRPDAPDRIIDPLLEKTSMGKVLLEADLQLKKDVSRMTDPATPEGRKYWDSLYAEAERLFQGEDASIPTVTRPWIVPGQIVLGVSDHGAYIYKATLKVMLEQDWYHTSGTPAQYISAPGVELSNRDFAGQPAGLSFPASERDPRIKQLNEYSSQLIRELIVPQLTREINASKRYASLRQVYYSLILAQWVKSRIKETPAFAAAFAANIDNGDISGLASGQPWSKETYYKEYHRSVGQGEYSKQESRSDKDNIVIRQYMSGGIVTQAVGAQFRIVSRSDWQPGGKEREVVLSSEVLKDGGSIDGEKPWPSTSKGIVEESREFLRSKRGRVLRLSREDTVRIMEEERTYAAGRNTSLSKDGADEMILDAPDLKPYGWQFFKGAVYGYLSAQYLSPLLFDYEPTIGKSLIGAFVGGTFFVIWYSKRSKNSGEYAQSAELPPSPRLISHDYLDENGFKSVLDELNEYCLRVPSTDLRIAETFYFESKANMSDPAFVAGRVREGLDSSVEFVRLLSVLNVSLVDRAWSRDFHEQVLGSIVNSDKSALARKLAAALLAVPGLDKDTAGGYLRQAYVEEKDPGVRDVISAALSKIDGVEPAAVSGADRDGGNDPVDVLNAEVSGLERNLDPVIGDFDRKMKDGGSRDMMAYQDFIKYLEGERKITDGLAEGKKLRDIAYRFLREDPESGISKFMGIQRVLLSRRAYYGSDRVFFNTLIADVTGLPDLQGRSDLLPVIAKAFKELIERAEGEERRSLFQGLAEFALAVHDREQRDKVIEVLGNVWKNRWSIPYADSFQVLSAVNLSLRDRFLPVVMEKFGGEFFDSDWDDEMGSYLEMLRSNTDEDAVDAFMDKLLRKLLSFSNEEDSRGEARWIKYMTVYASCVEALSKDSMRLSAAIDLESSKMFGRWWASKSGGMKMVTEVFRETLGLVRFVDKEKPGFDAMFEAYKASISEQTSTDRDAELILEGFDDPGAFIRMFPYLEKNKKIEFLLKSYESILNYGNSRFPLKEIAKIVDDPLLGRIYMERFNSRMDDEEVKTWDGRSKFIAEFVSDSKTLLPGSIGDIALYIDFLMTVSSYEDSESFWQALKGVEWFSKDKIAVVRDYEKFTEFDPALSEIAAGLFVDFVNGQWRQDVSADEAARWLKEVSSFSSAQRKAFKAAVVEELRSRIPAAVEQFGRRRFEVLQTLIPEVRIERGATDEQKRTAYLGVVTDEFIDAFSIPDEEKNFWVENVICGFAVWFMAVLREEGLSGQPAEKTLERMHGLFKSSVLDSRKNLLDVVEAGSKRMQRNGQQFATAARDGGSLKRDVGGIDMRVLPAQALKMAAGAVPPVSGVVVDPGNASSIDIDVAWKDILKKTKDAIPARELRCYLAVCEARGDPGRRRMAREYLGELLRQEEARAVDTDKDLLELIALAG